jgi:signal transduction histidine kinase
MKSNFVSSVSHELRSPTAAMRLLIEALHHGEAGDESKQREYLGLLLNESRRLSSVIENVLDFSRIERGRKEYEMHCVNANAVLTQTVDLMVPCANTRQVRLRIPDCSDADIPLVCDGTAIQQALVNLIDNAVKHTEGGGEVLAGLEADETTLSFWIEDKGPGTPPEEQARIFEQFYRRGSELRRETEGIGIGLTIVKQVAEAHGGRVLVRSKPGEGSRFTIELPMQEEREDSHV